MKICRLRAKAVQAGWKIAYCAGAKVYHCHNYTCVEQFHRNFDNGVSQAQHPEVLKGLPSESEGLAGKTDGCPFVQYP